jgi:L-threonylcarbamoyladenylate synthase
MGDLISLVIDGGRTIGGLESTVIDVSSAEGPRIVREGAVPREDIERVLGRKVA